MYTASTVVISNAIIIVVGDMSVAPNCLSIEFLITSFVLIYNPFVYDLIPLICNNDYIFFLDM